MDDGPMGVQQGAFGGQIYRGFIVKSVEVRSEGTIVSFELILHPSA